jgi:hypothetical protein
MKEGLLNVSLIISKTHLKVEINSVLMSRVKISLNGVTVHGSSWDPNDGRAAWLWLVKKGKQKSKTKKRERERLIASFACPPIHFFSASIIALCTHNHLVWNFSCSFSVKVRHFLRAPSSNFERSGGCAQTHDEKAGSTPFIMLCNWVAFFSHTLKSLSYAYGPSNMFCRQRTGLQLTCLWVLNNIFMAFNLSSHYTKSL